jgi:putative oxidoreductase
MKTVVTGLTGVLGRIMLAAIFLMSALGNKIPNFMDTADYMTMQGVPLAPVMLAGAIVFLVVGSICIFLGYKIRLGATLLLIFLIPATYYFHDFWTFEREADIQLQQIQFMKNIALMGAMLMLISRGAGTHSLDNRRLAFKNIPLPKDPDEQKKKKEKK